MDEEKDNGRSFEFTVNGQVQRTEEDKPLLRYLRDDLKLYSVKDGCSEGACGTCTIVVDGKAIKSCVLTTKKSCWQKHFDRGGLKRRVEGRVRVCVRSSRSRSVVSVSRHGDGRNGIITEQFKSD